MGQILASVKLQDLEYVTALRYSDVKVVGWEPRMRRRYGYYTPDDYYEALMLNVIREGAAWLDVGCGCDLFPNNAQLAVALSQKCSLLVGVDPDPAVKRNPFIHDYFHGPIEKYSSSSRFDVITMRMVAEHLADPQAVIEVFSKLLKPSGVLVVYTVNKWAAVPVLTKLLPFRFHQPIKKILWGTKEEETFPTWFRLNTQKALAKSLSKIGLEEQLFMYLDDCRAFARFRSLHFLELSLWRLLRLFKLRHYDNCLLGMYRLRKTDGMALTG